MQAQRDAGASAPTKDLLMTKTGLIKSFQAERKLLSLHQEEITEEATGTFYYQVFSRNEEVVMMRTVWDGGCCMAPKVYDCYYVGGDFQMLDVWSSNQGELKKLLKKGVDPSIEDETLLFANGNLYDSMLNGESGARQGTHTFRYKEQWGLAWGRKASELLAE